MSWQSDRAETLELVALKRAERIAHPPVVVEKKHRKHCPCQLCEEKESRE